MDSLTPEAVAREMASLVKSFQFDVAMERFYALDIVSVEGDGSTVDGIAAVAQKGIAWSEAHELHGGTVEGPFVAGARFALRMRFDVTIRATGARVLLDEVALYTVENGKIVHELFLYGMD